MEQSITLWAAGALLALLLLSYVRIYFRKGLKNLPGPVVARFSGLYRVKMAVGGYLPQNYRELHEEYGKIVRVGPNHVSISDATAVPTIYGIGTGSKFLKTPFYSTMTPIYQGEKMESMFTQRDPVQHKAFKVPVAQLFSMSNVKGYEPYADECSNIFIKAMQDLEGQPIDLAAWLQYYAFDVIACITFQRKFGFLEERRDIDGMIESIDGVLQYVRLIGQVPEWHPLLMGNRKFVAMIKSLLPNLPDPLAWFLDITEEEIARYDREEKQTTGRTDFLAQLRAREGRMSNRDVLNHLSNNLLAGSDTTAIALRACFYYLMKTPRAYNKLVAEIQEADKAGLLSPSITYEECLQLKFLQASMKEAMRLHPSVGFPLERFVPEGGANICGVDLPAGTNVSVSAPVIHTNKDIWGNDADEFRPERWIEADAEYLKVMDRNFLAFGYGARTCIGKNISIMEMGKLVPQVLRHFDLEWATNDTEWKLNAAWFWKQTNIVVKFKSREKV